MAYVNEYVRSGEQRSFIIKPWSHVYTPTQWTIDRDTGNVLFKTGVNRENPEEISFGFSYHGENYLLEMREPTYDPDHKWKFMYTDNPFRAYLAGFVAGRGKELHLTDIYTGTQYQFSRVGRPISLPILLSIIIVIIILSNRTNNRFEDSGQSGHMAEWLHRRHMRRIKLYTIAIFVTGIFIAFENLQYGLILIFLALVCAIVNIILYYDDD